MRIKIFMILTILAGSTLLINTSDAAIKIQAGKIRDAELVPTMPPEEHYAEGVKELEAGNYKEAAKHFNILSVNYYLYPEGQNSNYYLGVCYFERGEYDWANEAFTRYIKGQANPEHFEEAIYYKYCIADRFRNGARRRFYASKHLPKWANGKSAALDIYDEVVIAMPIAEIAACALYAKAYLQWELKCYKEAIESFQMLIKRFPRHELAPESYLAINRVYLDQSRIEFQNPDILAFAEINLRRFQRDFPKEPRLHQSESSVDCIKEVYAKGLYDIGQFYEKINEPRASVLYYQKAICEFPETAISVDCRSRLCVLAPGLVESQVEDFEVEEENFEDFEFTSIERDHDGLSLNTKKM